MFNARIRINKWDVVKSHLQEAVRLFFEQRDPIPLHSIIYAAHNVLRDLSKKCGGKSLLKDNPFIRPEMKKEFNNILNESGNFFKHADKDTKGEILFSPSFNAFLMFDCFMMYDNLERPYLKESFVFKLWFAANHQHLFEGIELKSLLNSPLAKKINLKDKTVFRDLLDMKNIIPEHPVLAAKI